MAMLILELFAGCYFGIVAGLLLSTLLFLLLYFTFFFKIFFITCLRSLSTFELILSG